MRRLLDLLALGVVIVLLLGLLHFNRRHSEREHAIEATRLSVERIQAEVNLLRALRTVGMNDAGHPIRVDSGWFDGELPVNLLLGHRERWIDLAGPGEMMRSHPRVWQVDPASGSEAMFWYNPVQGVVRARVPEQSTPEEARILYAQVNGLDRELD